MIYTESPRRFGELQDFLFTEDIRDELEDYKLNFLKFLFMIKEKWATSHMPLMFNAGCHTIMRAEAVNFLVKKAM
jgi:hypothetical protein